MRVFISWSGDKSRAVATVLRNWFPSVLQAVRPYFSPDDVSKGTRWSTEISKELEASRVGLLIVTPENQAAPWLLFEAGALAKNLDRAKVCPLLFDGMAPTDVEGPLVQFQAAQFSKEEMIRVIKMMNAELADLQLPQDVLDGVFEMWWPKLEEEVNAKLQNSGHLGSEGQRADRDLLEEILGLTRRIASDRLRRVDIEHPAWDDFLFGVSELIRLVQVRPEDQEMLSAIQRIGAPLNYIARRESRVGGRLRRTILEIDRLIEGGPKRKTRREPPDDAVL